MQIRFFVPWIVLVGILGFAIGGTSHWLVWGEPHNQTESYAKNSNPSDRAEPPESDKGKTAPQKTEKHKEHDWWGPEAWLLYVTVPLMVFTGLLFFYTRQLASDSVAMARNEFLATHRPRLRVRYFKKIGADPGKEKIRFCIFNVGDVSADMYSCRIAVEWLNPTKLPPLADILMKENLTDSLLIPRGNFEEREAASLPKMNVKTSQFLVVYGIIDYREGAGDGEWRTGFCRYFDPISERFFPVNDGDYEYED